MKQLLFLCILLAACASRCSFASDQCTQTEATTAETVTDYLDSWDSVYQFFKQFGHCYDGSIAEGANDKIQLLWANHWRDLPRMLELTKQDPKFKAFMSQRMNDQDFPSNEFAKILQNAKTSCPKGGVEFCKAFIQAAGASKP
jgi:hypothetical protein